MEVVSFSFPRIFKNEALELEKAVVVGALALCFSDAGRDLGVLDLNSSRRVGTCTTWFWIKGKLRFQSHIELFSESGWSCRWGNQQGEPGQPEVSVCTHSLRRFQVLFGDLALR